MRNRVWRSYETKCLCYWHWANWSKSVDLKHKNWVSRTIERGLTMQGSMIGGIRVTRAKKNCVNFLPGALCCSNEVDKLWRTCWLSCVCDPNRVPDQLWNLVWIVTSTHGRRIHETNNTVIWTVIFSRLNEANLKLGRRLCASRGNITLHTKNIKLIRIADSSRLDFTTHKD